MIPHHIEPDVPSRRQLQVLTREQLYDRLIVVHRAHAALHSLVTSSTKPSGEDATKDIEYAAKRIAELEKIGSERADRIAELELEVEQLKQPQPSSSKSGDKGGKGK